MGPGVTTGAAARILAEIRCNLCDHGWYHARRLEKLPLEKFMLARINLFAAWLLIPLTPATGWVLGFFSSFNQRFQVNQHTSSLHLCQSSH